MSTAKPWAEAGFVVAVFDASFQASSGGEPRFIEVPTLRVSDFRFVVDYLQTLPYVDAERIGLLGICGGGGYAVGAAMTDYRLKCCVGITPVNYGRHNREAFGCFVPAGALEKVAKQLTAEAQGGERYVLSALLPTVEDAKKISDDVVLNQATEYYKTDRGRHGKGTNNSLVSSGSAAPAWDAFNHAEVLMTKPFMMVVGEPGGFGAYRDALEIHGRAGSKVKKLVILFGVSHYMYDKPEAVEPALKDVLPFLEEQLGTVA